MTAGLIYEATLRFYEPPEIVGGIMLGTAFLSLIFNLIQIKILHSGEGGHVHVGGQKCTHSSHNHGDTGHDHHHHGHNHSHDHDDHDHHKHEHNHKHHDHKQEDDEDKESCHDNELGHKEELDEDSVFFDPGSTHDHEHQEERSNLNIDAATLHILGDLLNSAGVIVASIIIYIWPNLWWVDPLCTYLFALIVLYTTKTVFF